METQDAVLHAMPGFSLVFHQCGKYFSEVLMLGKTFPGTLALRVGTPELR